MDNQKLSDLLDLNDPGAVFAEVSTLLEDLSPPVNPDLLEKGFRDTVALYRGRYPGYRACNTEYHNLRHATDTFLTMARLLHGSHLAGSPFPSKAVLIGLYAALLHDAGYIQAEGDNQGTGAKYTANHVQRSADFLNAYCRENGFSREQRIDGQAIILCTDLAIKMKTLSFSSESVKRLGQLLMAADLMAQMADRIYLEKLLFLYHEFREAGMDDFASEIDLLRKTVSFYEVINQRLAPVVEDANDYLHRHFERRWNIPSNLYEQAIQRQIHYLKKILESVDEDPRQRLKRDGIVDRVREKYGESN